MEITDAGRFPAEILTFLGGILDLSFPKQGCTSEVAVIKCSRGKYVIKRSCGLKYCGWVRQEYRVLNGLSRTRMPVPKPHMIIESGSVDTPECWLVMDFLSGDTLRSVLEKISDQARRRKLLFSFGKALSEVHSATPPAEMLVDKRPWIDRKLDEAEYYLAHYEVDGTDGLLRHLKTNQPDRVQPALIHGDFTLDNVLVQGDEVTGIIDWAGGASGDPRYDIALAVRPEPGCFDTEEDLEAFFAGYGLYRLSREEYDYFNGIYEFF